MVRVFKWSPFLTVRVIIDIFIHVFVQCTYISRHKCTFLIGIRGTLVERNHRHHFQANASRATFITRQDARNIIRKLDNALKHRHKDDAISVDRLVQELEQEKPSPIIAYKPQGVKKEAYPKLSADNFLFVIMTQFQAEMFRKYSGRVVCVDSTHKTNPYGFKLVTIVVPDEFKNGQFVFTNIHMCKHVHVHAYLHTYITHF